MQSSDKLFDRLHFDDLAHAVRALLPAPRERRVEALTQPDGLQQSRQLCAQQQLPTGRLCLRLRSRLAGVGSCHLGKAATADQAACLHRAWQGLVVGALSALLYHLLCDNLDLSIA